MESSIFRKVALERLRSPDQLDNLMKIVSPRAWLMLLAVALLIVSGIVWSIAGSIPVRVDTYGILINSGGLSIITHLYGGKLSEIMVEEGDIVEKGDKVARIELYDLALKIEELKEEFKIISDEKKKELEIKLDQLQKEYEYRRNIVSSYSGKVIEVKLNEGDILDPEEPLISIEAGDSSGNNLEGVFYVEAYHGKEILPGMEVKITPYYLEKGKYGLLLGEVASVSEYPITHQELHRVLKNEMLEDMFAKNGASFEVKVKLIEDKSNPSQYKWTTPAGPPHKLSGGTLCKGMVTIERERPVELVLPVDFDRGNDDNAN